MQNPLVERFGGPRGVSRLVLRFYDLVLASERLRPFFEHIDMPRLVDHQAAFVLGALGGSPGPGDAEIAELHAHLDIDAEAFDEMIALFAAALEAEGHAGGDAARLLARFRRLRGRLVTATGDGVPAEA